MPTLPKTNDSLIQAFAPHFSNCIWQHAQLLPTLERVAADSKTRWQCVSLRNGYGEGCRQIAIVSQTAARLATLPALLIPSSTKT